MRSLTSVVTAIIFFCSPVFSQDRIFNYPVQLKTCNISIEADAFVATTFIEMEFYNPLDKEVEGRRILNFDKDQVVCGFQLDLNGKYREGSIEERWKANNAYNTVVGKRIDPAILQMYRRGEYSLNIYPVPARSSRKVTITLRQLLKEKDGKLTYVLPLALKDTVQQFSIRIRVKGMQERSYAGPGLIENNKFIQLPSYAVLDDALTGVVLNKDIRFHTPVHESTVQVCMTPADTASRFLLRAKPLISNRQDRKINTVTVFWDVSRSALSRKLSRELDYLEAYAKQHMISTMDILLFNDKLLGKLQYNLSRHEFETFRRYLLNYKYTGGTELACLNFASVKSDLILLFSDGSSTFGKSLPQKGKVQVNVVVSGTNFNGAVVEQICIPGGGRVINLNDQMDVKRYAMDEFAKNYLIKVSSAKGNIAINEKLPIIYDQEVNLSGIATAGDTLELTYGNTATGTQVQKIVLRSSALCDEVTAGYVRMLKSYDSLMNDRNGRGYYSWYDQLAFGIKEKVVTYQTAFIVLERIEDYIKFNIAPPAELEEACRQQNYVYKSEYRLKALEDHQQTQGLQALVDKYNDRIVRWNNKAPLIDLTKPFDMPASGTAKDVAQNDPVQKRNTFMLPLQPGGGELKEVVVTGAFGTRRAARSAASNVQFISGEQLDVVRQTNINNALAGKVAGVQVRSQSLAKLGAETHIRIRGENSLRLGGSSPVYVVNGTIIENAFDINVDDIEDVTVLQGPAAAALYGPDGANGAIVINYKRAKKYYHTWGSYDLESAEDEDYLLAIRESEEEELYANYLLLEKMYHESPLFYFDMARFFYERHKKKEAMHILSTAAEISSYSSKGLRAIAYILEEWKEYAKAIAIYKGIIANSHYDPAVNRELALAYYQYKQYQQAVDILNEVVSRPDNDDENFMYQKELALAEMNAYIAASPVVLDLSATDLRLVKAMPVQLRITVSGNESLLYYSNVTITEPGGKTAGQDKPATADRGYISKTSDQPWAYYNYRRNYNNAEFEYVVRKPNPGTFRVSVTAHDWYADAKRIPSYVRVITFRNFQSAGLAIEVKTVQIDNQYGDVGIAKIRW